MLITTPSALRSLRNEASRQAEFFASRDQTVTQFWSHIEGMAHMALTSRKALRLILCEQNGTELIIKGCEQVQ